MPSEKNFPVPTHKFITAIAFGVLAVVAVFLFYMTATNTVHGPFVKLQSPISPSPVKENFFDSDADGLADIEEGAFGTSIENPDTDGDGYLDGEEVAQDTNPLAAESIPASESILTLLQDQTEGKNMSREFVGNILGDITQNDRLFWTESASSDKVTLNLSYTPETAEQLAGKFSDQLLKEPDIASLRAIDDATLHITDDVSANAINTYVSQYMGIIGNTEHVALLRAYYERLMENASEAGIAITPALRAETASSIIPMLAATEEALRDLTVPATWVELHKDQIALIAGQRTALQYLLNARGDILKQFYAMAILQKVQEDSDEWKTRATALLNS